MREHVAEKHESCDLEHCNVCVGGLFICTVCNCAEGTLTPECPGLPVSGLVQDDIYAGRIDFRGGDWIKGVAVGVAHLHPKEAS